MKKPKPTASSLRRKSGWVIASVAVDERDDRAGDERAEDHLEPELLGERGEADEQHERARGRGSARSCPAAAAGPRGCASSARRRATATNTIAASTNSAPSSSSVEPVPPSPEKKIESRMIAPKSAIDAAGDDQLAERRGDLARRP